MSDIKFINTNTIDDDNLFNRRIYNDINFLPNNDLEMVYGSDYVVQQVAKVLNTDQYSSDYFPGYGTTLNELRRSPSGDSLLESAVQDTIVSAISYIRTLEESPRRDEQITGLNNIVIESQDIDRVMKALDVSMEVVTAAGQVVKVTV